MKGYYPHLSFKVTLYAGHLHYQCHRTHLPECEVASLYFHCFGPLVGSATRNVVLRGAGPYAVLSLALGIVPQRGKALYMCMGTCCWIMRTLLGKWLLFLPSFKLKVHSPSWVNFPQFAPNHWAQWKRTWRALRENCTVSVLQNLINADGLVH